MLDGQWHHVAGTFTADDMTLFFDGQQVCSMPQKATFSYVEGSQLRVAHDSERIPHHDFQGNIDDVRVYTRALSAAEIANLFAGAL